MEWTGLRSHDYVTIDILIPLRELRLRFSTWTFFSKSRIQIFHVSECLPSAVDSLNVHILHHLSYQRNKYTLTHHIKPTHSPTPSSQHPQPS
jgi:hypothetical protein